jgi:L-lactate dehydrogenase (cytochrome)
MLGTRRHTFRNIIGHVEGAGDLSQLQAWTNSQFDPRLNWGDVGWIKDRFGGPVIIKGVLDADDARLAVEAGADAIIVSNHGGRQLDSAPSSIRVLPEIAEAVGDKTDVYLDGGIRSGQDVLKALALGAKSTFIGRAYVFGLGAGGEAGVTRALDIIRRELDITMAHCGERDITRVGRHNVYATDF